MFIFKLMPAAFLVAATAGLPASAASPAQAHAPWFGSWNMSLAGPNSNSNPSAFKRVICSIEPWGDGLKVTYDMVGARGGVTHLEWNGRFDARDYPVQGVNYVLTNAYSQIDDQSYRVVIKRDGEIVATAKSTISPDRKTITTITVSKNAQGQDVSTTTVYNRQQDGR